MTFKSLYRWLVPGASSPRQATNTEALANQGDAEAQFSMGLRHLGTDGNPGNPAAAAHWFEKAAIQQHVPAQFNFALILARGDGVTRDESAARKWMTLAAAQGHAGAQFDLGSRSQRLSVGGTSASQAEQSIEAYKWFRLSAEQGNHTAAVAWEQISLGMTREQVAEGDRRTLEFSSPQPLSPKTASVTLP